MRSFICLIVAALAMIVIACDSIAQIGDQNIATCEHKEIYFVFDLNSRSISAWNTTTERMDVWIRQERNSDWFDVFSVRLRSTNESSPRHHTAENVQYDEGTRFALQVKQYDEREWNTVWLILQREGEQLNIQFLPDST